jgi:signal peptidase I
MRLLLMPKPRIVAAAWLLSLAFAFYSLASALFEPPALLFAVIFSAITIGILKRRAWSAYGASLLFLSIGCTFLLLTARNPARPQIPWTGLAFWIGLMLAVAFVFYRAGTRPAQGSRRLWIGLAAAVFLFPQIMRPFSVPVGSMEDTILIGDRILVRPLAGTPTRGEVNAFRYPVDPRQTLIKRIIAIGGDRLRIDNKSVLLNGAPLTESYAVHKTDYMDSFRDNFPTRAEYHFVAQLGRADQAEYGCRRIGRTSRKVLCAGRQSGQFA